MNKVVIVTGSSGGLGGAIATEFGLAGAKVVICDVAFLDEAEGVAKKINEGGGEAFIYEADVRDYSQVKAMVAATLDRWQRIDVLVNNAGGGTPLMGLGGTMLTELEEEGVPLYVTQHGKPKAVLSRYDEYEALLRKIEDMEDLLAMKESLAAPDDEAVSLEDYERQRSARL